jgi:tetratricopeptide (TPR) repeat protein
MEAIEYYEQILGVFRWLEFTEEGGRNGDFFKAMNLEPIVDKDIVVKEKDLGDDECEIEMRTNLVVTMLLNMSYCYLRMHHHSEALRCLDYGLELAPIAADCYFRRSQVRLYNRKSTVKELRLAMDDANKALDRRPKDKIYHKHKALVEQGIRDKIVTEVKFIEKLLEKAEGQVAMRRKIIKMKKLRE